MCESESVFLQQAAGRWGEGGRKEREEKEEKKKKGRREADLGGAREAQSEEYDQNK